MSVIDTASHEVIETIVTSQNTPRYIVATLDGSKIYVTNTNNATISVIDTTS